MLAFDRFLSLFWVLTFSALTWQVHASTRFVQDEDNILHFSAHCYSSKKQEHDPQHFKDIHKQKFLELNGERLKEEATFITMKSGRFSTKSMDPTYISIDERMEIFYLTEQGRESSQLFLFDGKFYKSDLSLYSTNSEQAIGNRPWEGDLLVADELGNLFVHPKIRSVIHHSSILSAAPVSYAGIVTIVDGVITRQETYSGHYKPGKNEEYNFVRYQRGEMFHELPSNGFAKVTAKAIEIPMYLSHGLSAEDFEKTEYATPFVFSPRDREVTDERIIYHGSPEIIYKREDFDYSTPEGLFEFLLHAGNELEKGFYHFAEEEMTELIWEHRKAFLGKRFFALQPKTFEDRVNFFRAAFHLWVAFDLGAGRNLSIHDEKSEDLKTFALASFAGIPMFLSSSIPVCMASFMTLFSINANEHFVKPFKRSKQQKGREQFQSNWNAELKSCSLPYTRFQDARYPIRMAALHASGDFAQYFNKVYYGEVTGASYNPNDYKSSDKVFYAGMRRSSIPERMLAEMDALLEGLNLTWDDLEERSFWQKWSKRLGEALYGQEIDL